MAENKNNIFQGKNQQCNNVVNEIDSLDSKFPESFEIANYFSNIGVKLNEHAKIMKNGNDWTAGNARTSAPLNFDKFTFQEISNCQVSQYFNSLKSRKAGGINQIPAFIQNSRSFDP